MTVPTTTDHRETAAPERFQFRIRDLLLVMLLVGLAAGTIAQRSALLLLLLLVAFGCCAYLWRELWKPMRLMHLFAVCGVLVVLAGLLLPNIDGGSRIAGRRMACQNNLKQIVIGLHNYHDTYGLLPPAFIADKNGQPMHSWRVLLLPFMGQESLYKQYRFDEPWDGPNNRKLADQLGRIYSCPSEPHFPSTETSYVAIIGPRTAWPGEKQVGLADITDGTSNVLIVVEVHDSGIHWMEPRDLHVNQMATTINSPHGQGIGSHHKASANAARADGSVRSLSGKLPADVLRSWINIDDGTLPEPE